MHFANPVSNGKQTLPGPWYINCNQDVHCAQQQSWHQHGSHQNVPAFYCTNLAQPDLAKAKAVVTPAVHAIGDAGCACLCPLVHLHHHGCIVQQSNCSNATGNSNTSSTVQRLQ